MKPRYNERVPVKAPVIFNVGALNGEGHVLDLTIPGCLIESPTAVKRGDYVQLIIALPRLTSTISVPLAAIRWTNGGQFGVEFIKMSEDDRRNLHHVVQQHLSFAAATTQTNGRRFSDPGGSNWHLKIVSGMKN